MMRMIWGFGVLLLAAQGCADGAQAVLTAVDSPPAYLTVPESALTFLRPAPGAPPLAQLSVSFWAVQGRTREGVIFYQKRPGAPAANRLVRFKVDQASLVNRPDGTPLLPGDSVLITLTVVDTLRLIVEFQPAGLTFNPRKKPQLTFWYLEADHDFNGDGIINAADTALERSFEIWGEEQPGNPWSDLVSVPQPGNDQIEARVPGFTRYAVSY